MHSILKKQLCNENILLSYSKLNDEMLGYYYSIDDLDLIVINESIISNTKQLNCVIAEELGHYYTTHGNYAPYSCNESNDKINHSRVELRALKWAVDFLIPTSDLLKYLSINHEIDYSDISNYFEVTEDFIIKKFYYMSLVKNIYHISDSKFLVLSNYPNVFIYEDYEGRLSDGIHSKTS
jgi:Zn-dependent peptidase ImmA (M78 family)